VLAVASVPLMLGPVCLLADINFGRSSAVPLMLGPVYLLAYINFGRSSAVPLMLGPVCLLAYINFGRSLVVLLMLGPLCLLADINFGMSLAVAVDVWVSLPSGKFRTLNVYNCPFTLRLYWGRKSSYLLISCSFVWVSEATRPCNKSNFKSCWVDVQGPV
jgi:hypothetical protein